MAGKQAGGWLFFLHDMHGRGPRSSKLAAGFVQKSRWYSYGLLSVPFL